MTQPHGSYFGHTQKLAQRHLPSHGPLLGIPAQAIHGDAVDSHHGRLRRALQGRQTNVDLSDRAGHTYDLSIHNTIDMDMSNNLESKNSTSYNSSETKDH